MNEPGNSAPGSTAQGSAPAAQPSAPAAPFSATAQRPAQQSNERSRGHSPARDAREAAAGGQQTEQSFEIDGVKYEGKAVRDALAAKAAADVRKSGLPADPNGYQIALPSSFKAPEGMAFEFDANDPLLGQARQAAHEEGLSQEQFSKMLGLFAADKVGQLQNTQKLVAANREKLGSAADQRLNAIDQWMTAIAGGKAKPMMAALKQYPMVDTVEALETVIRRFSNQGGAEFNQSHREQQAEQGKIPNYENMSFTQRRAAQDALNTRGGPRR